MSPMRAQPAKSYRALKSRTQQLADLLGGGSCASGFTRVPQSQMSRYASLAPDQEAVFAPIDVVLDLEQAAGAPVVTRALAELNGYFLVQAPPATRHPDALARVTMAALREVSEAFAALADAQADGKITACEAPGVVAQIDDALVMLMTIRAHVQAKGDAE